MKVGQNADKKSVLEELLGLGMVLVAIDARAEGVDVPEHLGADPQLRLNLSYRFGRPMHVDDWGISADLTFGGDPHTCQFPWNAIFLIVSHVNGESYLFPDHVPQELLHQAATEQLEAAAKPPKKAAPKRNRPKLSLVHSEAADTNADEPADNAQAPSPQTQAPAPAPVSEPLPADGPAEPADAPESPLAPSDASLAPPDPESPPKKTTRSRGHLRLIK
jgi:stringent starvation protein B